MHNSGVSAGLYIYILFGGGGEICQGVRGYAPPENFKHLRGEILQNSEDYKVHQRHDFFTILIKYNTEIGN
jgi:hypothetical protein